jgi:hypothetical protein
MQKIKAASPKYMWATLDDPELWVVQVEKVGLIELRYHPAMLEEAKAKTVLIIIFG